MIKSLNKNYQFKLLNKIGIKCFTAHFILISCEREKLFSINQIQDDRCHFAVKVSKKLGNAVLRNKIKRRIRHAVRILSNQADFKNRSFVVIPRSKCANIDFKQLQYDIARSVSLNK